MLVGVKTFERWQADTPAVVFRVVPTPGNEAHVYGLMRGVFLLLFFWYANKLVEQDGRAVQHFLPLCHSLDDGHARTRIDTLA